MIKKLTCGELLVQQLEAYGITTIFGIPGVHTIEFYRGLNATNIRHITPRHEQGAGFMADGYARASGNVAACFIITGPGMTNIMTAMAQSYADSVPMLVISSVNSRATLGLGQGRLHELPNQQATISGVCAFSHTLMSPSELPDVLARAFTVFNSERPRPVHIEIPLDVITMEASHVLSHPITNFFKPAPSDNAIDRCLQLLENASMPILLLGGGSINANRQEIIRLAETFDMPVAYTINAKGIFPSDHPLSLGSNQSTMPVRSLIANADVILAIGTELGETDYDTVFDGQFIINGQIIRVDIDSSQLQCNYHAALGIISDASFFISALHRATIKQQLPTRFIIGQSPGACAASKVQIALSENYWPTEWAYQLSILDHLKSHYPDIIFVGDSTQIVYSGNHLFESDDVRHWFNASTGYGTLGYALPAAMGAIFSGKQHVIALVGDGGLQFTINELATAVEEQLPLVILLWNNQGYQEIKRYMLNHNIETIGVDIYTPDFIKISEGYGCHTEILKSPKELPCLLTQAFQRQQPTLIMINEHELYSYYQSHIEL